jgi:hypothetical protein
MDRLAYSLPEAARVAGVSRTRIFEASRNGQLTVRKAGRASIVTHDDLMAWILSLPIKGRQPDEATADANDRATLATAKAEPEPPPSSQPQPRLDRPLGKRVAALPEPAAEPPRSPAETPSITPPVAPEAPTQADSALPVISTPPAAPVSKRPRKLTRGAWLKLRLTDAAGKELRAQCATITEASREVHRMMYEDREVVPYANPRNLEPHLRHLYPPRKR